MTEDPEICDVCGGKGFIPVTVSTKEPVATKGEDRPLCEANFIIVRQECTACKWEHG